jgi:molecular chaperone Hsp33
MTAPGPGEQTDSVADLCLPFALDGGAFRGRLVRLTASVSEILERHKDPEPVSVLMGEAMAAAVALAGGLKYDGIFTLQVQGKGPIHTLVTDVTSDGDLRCWARFDADRLAEELARPRPSGLMPQLLGPGGHLAFTVDQGPDTERFQGIVELTGESLADAVHHYFRQSEQLESALKIAVSPPRESGRGWTAAALVIQRMPEEGGHSARSRDDLDDAWRTAVIFLGSLKDAELLDLAIGPERLLSRLYATLGVIPGARRPIRAKCRCSHERSERILASFPVDEIKSFAQDGQIHMTCEFCRSDYVFLEKDLEAIAEKYRSKQSKVIPP